MIIYWYTCRCGSVMQPRCHGEMVERTLDVCPECQPGTSYPPLTERDELKVYEQNPRKKKIPMLYHGSLKKHLKKIEKYGGLRTTQGWGGHGTVGVFLSGTYEGALLWAKIGYMVQTGQGFAPHKFDQKYPGDKAWNKIMVLAVEIPPQFESLLKADLEQAEDTQFDGEEDDWRASLKQIGDVRFDSDIPTSWLTKITP